jgi:hypothetical protein
VHRFAREARAAAQVRKKRSVDSYGPNCRLYSRPRSPAGPPQENIRAFAPRKGLDWPFHVTHVGAAAGPRGGSSCLSVLIRAQRRHPGREVAVFLGLPGGAGCVPRSLLRRSLGCYVRFYEPCVSPGERLLRRLRDGSVRGDPLQPAGLIVVLAARGAIARPVAWSGCEGPGRGYGAPRCCACCGRERGLGEPGDPGARARARGVAADVLESRGEGRRPVGLRTPRTGGRPRT